MHIDRYERMYIIAASAVMGAFFAALLASALVFGIHLPEPAGFVNPRALNQTEFANPGLRDMGNNRYEAYIVAQMWQFNVGVTELDPTDNTPVLRIPEGAQVTFYITSADVTHGFIIERQNVNIEVVPGHVARATHTFREAGTYKMLCHEYCGRLHQNMHMTLIVEPTESESASAAAEAAEA